MTDMEFGPEQLRIMHVLWDRKRATAQEITDTLCDQEPVKLVNVQMILKRLVEKDAVAYDVSSRKYIYYPLVENRKVVKGAVRKMVENVFAGSVDDLVSYILNNEKVSPDTLKKVRAKIEESDVY